jgi:hypothetical protein
MTKSVKTLNSILVITATILALLHTHYKANAEQPDNVFTSVVVSVIDTPDPVKGSDGMYHLVYELEAVNATGLVWTINSVEILGDGKAVTTLKGEELANRMELLKDRSHSTTLQPGEAGIIFIHFTEEGKDIPASIAHNITISAPNGMPKGFKKFAGIPADSDVYTYMTDTTRVGSSNAIVLSPPLEGNGWVAADGCCDSIRHVRSMMPINDKLHIAQRFAIDWEMINKDKRIYTGEAEDVNSYFAYGKNVLAVANAKVVAAVDKYDNQVPGKLPPGMTLEEADGNHIVLDLGGGKYALYAHLKPGSVKVKKGDKVKKGQVIALVGNTGNTSAPHLHFHVMDGPSTLGSNGLPYMIDEFDLTGKAPSTEAFDKAETEGTPLEVVPVRKPGIHKNELPLDQRVANFIPDKNI